MRLLYSLLFAAVAATASAQTCATLTATGTGAPGTDLTFALEGGANAFAFLALGDTAGTTTINLGQLGSLTLDLAQPFVPMPLGLTDANGDISRTFNIPAGLPATDLLVQGLTLTFTLMPTPGLSACTSNVASVHVGP